MRSSDLAKLKDAPFYWNDEQRLECVMVMPETQNAKTFFFKVDDEQLFNYEPGQFITIEVPTENGVLHRSYTLSTTPSRPLSIGITVKRQEDGQGGSAWLLDNLKLGDTIKAYGPSGIFSCRKHPAKKYLFISAGSGVTPMISMLRWLYDYSVHTDIAFIHCAARPSEILFRDEVEHMSKRDPDIKVSWVVKDTDRYDVWTGFQGRFNQIMLELIAPDFASREIFCCGSEGFMQSVRDILHAEEFDMNHYHEESFGAPIYTQEDTPEHNDVIPADDVEAQIYFNSLSRGVACKQTDTLLSVAKEVGVDIPSACMFGVCGSCKIKKASGEVHMIHNGGISDSEIESGYVLACCSRAIGRVVLEV
uniref:hybrid-cluster NAD(P)-dependent oxidoreductase n=1 Tax=Marinobacterium profundum TaxID=1714300 RepID=UPI000830A867|nr:hybrid-cluster NAD(P)-dependent oxidoreductase [Marinobacterium profundum]